MTQRSKSARKPLPSKAQVQDALAEDWFAVSNRHTKGKLAETLEENDYSTIDRAITKKNLPGLHKALAPLLIDPTALSHVLALYGGRFVPDQTNAANDLHTVGELTGLATAFLKVLEDGVRDHVETLELAKLICPLVAKLSAILEEARRIQGAAA